MKQFIRVLLFTVSCFCLLAATAGADTLEMKDGRLLSGKYLGGTSTSIRFQADGRIRVHRVVDVLALTFSDAVAQAAPEAPAASTAPGRYPATAPPVYASRNDLTIPAGARLMVRMIDSVDSDSNRVGDRFHASLSEDLRVDTTTVARRGTDVYGRLAKVSEAGSITGRSALALELTEIRINGQLHSLASGDYEVAGESRTADSAKKIGGGAAIGAVIGAIAGGGKGAAIGAGVGAGAGTAVQVMTRGEKVRVPSETLLEFRLEQPVTIRDFFRATR